MKSFKEQFDKMTALYIHGKVNAFNNEMCFCGNLEDGNIAWSSAKKIEEDQWEAIRHTCNRSYDYRPLEYTPNQYWEMEAVFMFPISKFLMLRVGSFGGACAGWIDSYNNSDVSIPEYEDALYQGFTNAIEVLKRIHIARGEKVEETGFEKREKNVAQLV